MVRPARSMRPAGFEPTTYCLEGSCSIRMSYDLRPYRISCWYIYNGKQKKSTALSGIIQGFSGEKNNERAEYMRKA